MAVFCRREATGGIVGLADHVLEDLELRRRREIAAEKEADAERGGDGKNPRLTVTEASMVLVWYEKRVWGMLDSEERSIRFVWVCVWAGWHVGRETESRLELKGQTGDVEMDPRFEGQS